MPIVDLRPDYARVRSHIRARVRKYSRYVNAGPGRDEDAISEITLGFELDQAGWFALVFDTRPDPDLDGGEWTLWIEQNMISRKKWIAPLGFSEGHGGLRRFSYCTPRETVSVSDDAGFEAYYLTIASTLTHALKDAARAGELAPLPTTQQCRIRVVCLNGDYAWPQAYEERNTRGSLSRFWTR